MRKTMTPETIAEDTALWARYTATRETAVREEIILRYVPLVRFVLNRLSIEPGSEYEDLLSQGLLGLIDAVDKFDPTRGVSFSTYATHRIRGHILDGLRSLDLLSRSSRRRVRQIESAMTDLRGRLGRAPEDQELASHLGMEMNEFKRATVDAARVLLSLDAGTDDDSEPYDVVSADEVDPLEMLAENDTQAEVMEALASLSHREQMILSLYYRDGLTMKEIGAVLDISESRVCQLHGRALLSLRSIVNAKQSEGVL
jgi:RNA polymerase sigma factor for flagellar operon FliA